mgnify:CR=1 FL=1
MRSANPSTATAVSPVVERAECLAGVDRRLPAGPAALGRGLGGFGDRVGRGGDLLYGRGEVVHLAGDGLEALGLPGGAVGDLLNRGGDLVARAVDLVDVRRDVGAGSRDLVGEGVDLADRVPERADEVVVVLADLAIAVDVRAVRVRLVDHGVDVDSCGQVAVTGSTGRVGEGVDESLKSLRTALQIGGRRLQFRGVRPETVGHPRQRLAELAGDVLVEDVGVEPLARQRVSLCRDGVEVVHHRRERSGEAAHLVGLVRRIDRDVRLTTRDLPGRRFESGDGSDQITARDEHGVGERDRGRREQASDEHQSEGSGRNEWDHRLPDRYQKLNRDGHEYLPLDRPVDAECTHRPPEEGFVAVQDRHR